MTTKITVDAHAGWPVQVVKIYNDGTFKTVERFGHAYEDELRDVYRTGDIQKIYTFAEVRENSNK